MQPFSGTLRTSTTHEERSGPGRRWNAGRVLYAATDVEAFIAEARGEQVPGALALAALRSHQPRRNAPTERRAVVR